MDFAWLKSPLRWINLHPFWQWQRVPVWGSRLRAPTFDRWLALQLHRVGLMGVADRRFLETQIKAGMTVVDIGANQGLYSLLFSKLVGGDGCVLAFEPDDLLHAALSENLAVNRASQMHTFHKALGSKQGTMTLYRSLLNSGDNRLSAQSSKAGPREAVTVEIERLDQILSGRRIHFIKMDVQGWEMEVFHGIHGILADPGNAEMAIYFEYWPQGLRDAGAEPQEPLNFLAKNGFEICSFDSSGTSHPLIDIDNFANSITGNAYVNLLARRGLR